MSRFLAQIGCAAALSSGPFATSVALGQTSSSVAEALFNDGRALYDQRRFDEACAKFQESDRLEPAVGAKLNLALCEEARGRVATAWALFRVVHELLPAGDPRSALAIQHREALASRVPYITVRLRPSAPTDTKVTVDDTPLAAASFGTALPVDPGSRRLRASAPGRQDSTTTLEVHEGQSTVVDLEPGPVVAATAAPLPAEPAASAPPPTEPSAITPLRIAALGTAGAGAISLVLGIVFSAQASSKNEDSAELGCQSNYCPPDAKQARLDALAAADRATAFGIAGAALVAGGAVLWFAGAPEEKVRAGVNLRPDRIELSLRGSLPQL